jgi:hypothetical protein
MEQVIGCDAHTKFSLFVAVDEKARRRSAARAHNQQLYREFLGGLHRRNLCDGVRSLIK